MMEIKGAEDFGLAFNCMTRLYVWSHKESILNDMLLVLRRYVSFFSMRTIVCSLRDFIDKVPFYDSDDIPDSQSERCEKVWKLLVRQGLTLDRERNLYKSEDVLICDFGRDIYFCNSPFENTV